jgi:small subunit ribosomal protein S13
MFEFPKSFFLSQKSLFISLTSIYGVGRATALSVCARLGLSPYTRVQKVPKPKLEQLRLLLTDEFVLGPRLKFHEAEIFRKITSQNSYRGRRLLVGLPVRGQRTHSNGATAFKLKSRYSQTSKIS